MYTDIKLSSAHHILVNALAIDSDLWGCSPLDLLADNMALTLAEIREVLKLVEPNITNCTLRVRNKMSGAN